ncbi:DNA-directed RNA polymerase sigma-70 factor [Bacteroidia bacterium]|nr:DNA-directed RNA polymerase sigma-70 factor [Bacteroidia bacterium]
MTDEYLIDLIKQDDYNSYNLLFRRYYPRLCHFVTGMIHEKSDAEDIVQEMFIKLWQNRQSLTIEKTFSSYIYQAAKNSTLNHIRSEVSRREAQEKIEAAEEFLANEGNNENEDFSIALEDCIDQLPAKSKEVILMHHLQGYMHKEISEKQNTSIQTIKNQIWLSLRRLRDCLGKKSYRTIK